jgi:hypothetical protein
MGAIFRSRLVVIGVLVVVLVGASAGIIDFSSLRR